ncbi:uncharacterized protein CC84DRAFT_1079568 [Paraphaeosphaeria sporulosa]|uniref:GRF-like zinc ribbon domain-containing protein n=1 Tax=Paraphaeosphaeria sporulosa TaxID=1460663 RepID=A0A177D1A2_9PLEO|nr:uncharacterized protein CC84DRAFT_1079568 [Paraphaeosphaeria sporulosa]OAG13188.1 hypothetical protein CC84DRAFT_1079568 [Paraphaeosphaeria sporulosa]
MTTSSTPAYPSRCRRCDSRVTLMFTRSNNRIGNAGRPYYKCLTCTKFLCFADSRGLDPSNPLCSCGIPSRRQISGPARCVPRGLHYVCSQGGCSFYSPMHGDYGQISLDEEIASLFIQLSFI